jgi:hypothetical protein
MAPEPPHVNCRITPDCGIRPATGTRPEVLEVSMIRGILGVHRFSGEASGVTAGESCELRLDGAERQKHEGPGMLPAPMNRVSSRKRLDDLPSSCPALTRS